MDRWDLLLIGIAAYVAVMTLVRLMARRRNQVIRQLQRDVKEQAAAQAKKNPESSDKEAKQDVA